MRSDRWSNLREIKNTLKCFTKDKSSGGPILYCSNGMQFAYDKEGHMVILGVSGSGKSRRCIMAMIYSLILAGESFFVVDPKGEIYKETAGMMRENSNLHVIDFRHIFESERWNPLTAPYELYVSGDPVKKQAALEMIDELAFALYPVNDKADPFWPESARSVFIAVVLALFDHARPEEISMASVYQVIARGEERCGGQTVLKTFVESLDPESIAAMLLQSYVSTANDTRAGIRSTFLEGISMFARSEGLIQMLGTDDLHINQLDGSKQTGIYVILPDENPIFDRLAGILCSQIMSHYVRLAQDKYQGKLPCRLNVCLEELGNIGKAIGNLPHLMSAGRSRNIRVQIVLQSLSQLCDIYGPNNATTILSNADVTVAFRTNHWDTLSELSRKCGEREIDNGGHISREPLITQSQLGAMATGQALVLISGSVKFITWLPDYRDMFDFADWKPPKKACHKTRHRLKTFNVTEYTKSIRSKKINEMFSENSPLNSTAFDSVLKTEEAISEFDGFNTEDLVARIDAKIAELAEEEKAERELKTKPHQVVVTAVGDELPAIARAIASLSVLSIKAVTKELKALPASFDFVNKAEAQEALKRVKEAGGKGKVQINPSNK